MARSIGPGLRYHWGWTSKLPGGNWLFSRLLGLVVPYTGSIGANVKHLEPGYCVVVVQEHNRIRNHLHSVHAIALCNLGEMATGLALLNSLPDKTRGILTNLAVTYLKKARGELTASCRCNVPEDNSEADHLLTGEIRNAEGELVAEVIAHWLIGPEKPD
jgi:acyl-coenzyme A thioesterase PaaI-like protein